MTHHCRLGYRPDIEGLRALAISLVVASHAQIPQLAGGFIGVDIFFVLSGYLISGLLLKEIADTGRLKLVPFYVRRLKRLLPALLLMLVVTALAATVIIAPFEQQSHAKATGYASVWLSNLYFALTQLNYFDAHLNQQLHLHTWSLGVEEQFYLLWPMLLLFFLGAFGWQGRQRNYPRLRNALLAVLLLCTLLAVFLAHTTPAWGFYLMPARAGQFALGALVLFARSGWQVKRITHVVWLHNPWVLNGLATLGLVWIVAAALWFDLQTPYPSFWALGPSAATALLLFVGASQTLPVVSKLLSLPPLQWLGKRSYSWYLWHWPVLILGHELPQYALSNATLLALSLFLAMLSYYFLEFPVRNSRYLARKTHLTLLASLSLMAAVFGLSQLWQQKSQQWSSEPAQARFEQVRDDLPEIYAMGCDDWFYSAQVKFCLFGNEAAQKTAVLVGDSVGAQWFPAVAKLYSAPDWRLLVFTKSSCPMVDEPYFYARIGREYHECRLWREAVFAWIRQFQPDVVFIGSNAAEFSQQQWVDGTQRLLADISAHVGQIFILQPTLALPFDAPACLAKQQWQANRLRALDCSAQVDAQQNDALRRWLQEAAKPFSNVKLLNMNPIICPQTHCDAMREGQIVFRDTQHLSRRYVESLAEVFAQQMAKD